MKSVGLYKLSLNEKFGDGILGRSYKAYHEITNEVFTIKVLPKSKNTQNKHNKEHLKSQIKHLSKVKHENIASYIDIIETTNHYYILRQFCPDGSLLDLMKIKGTFSENEVIAFLIQVLKGMFELIEKGIIHKNLIPENILFNKDVLKISDFGCVKIRNEILQCQTKIKSQYKSPQMLDGQKGGFKCDVWSMGIIVYEMIYGKYPWVCNSQKELRENIKKEKLKFPAQVPISMGMKKFIMSCLMQDTNQRAQWKDIFDANFLHQYNLPKLNDLNEKYSKILSMLKSSILETNLDIELYFRSKHLSSHDFLTKKAFCILVKPMIPEITDEEIEFLFVSLDTNGDNSLQVSEFEDAMKEFEIPLQGSYRRIGEKLLKDSNIDKEMADQEQREKELAFIFKGIIQNLQKKQIYDLYDLFQDSDKKRVGVLEFDDFVNLLRKIDKTLTKTECEKIFNAFDSNGDRKISFKQFFANMCKVTGSPNGLPNC